MRTGAQINADLQAACLERVRLEDRIDRLRAELDALGDEQATARRDKKRAIVTEMLARFDGGDRAQKISRAMKIPLGTVGKILWRNGRYAMGRIPPSQFPEHAKHAYRVYRAHGYRPAVARTMALNLGEGESP